MNRFFTKNTRIVLVRLFIIAVTAILFTFFLEWRFLDSDFDRVLNFVTTKPQVFFYNALLFAFLESLITAIWKTPWTGPGISFALTIIISYISVQKQAFRGQPLLPDDFMLTDQAGTISKFIDIWSLIRMLLAVALVIALTLLLNHLTKSFFAIEKKQNLRLFRIILAVVAVVGFFGSTNFIRHHSGERDQDVPFLCTKFVAWNQMVNYEDNGFIIGFLYNLSKFKMAEPSDYSESKIAEIKSSYENPESKTSLSSADYNIVVILNESFYDPEIISDFYPVSANHLGDKNSMNIPITSSIAPTIQNLIKNDQTSKNYAIGQMYSTDYGGGTANIEFEVDTGMTNYWANTVPYVDLFPHLEKVPSIAQIAKQNGYKTLAIHPFNAGMYKRNIALKKEGFDDFIDESRMTETEKDDHREYINDRSAYNETLKYLTETDEKLLVSLITMQNHAGYGSDNYSSRSYHLASAPKNDSSNPFSDDERNEVEIYLETLHNSDYYLGEFLKKLEKFDEKTVILFYGDHAPGVFGRVDESKDKSASDLSRITPYLIWANFDLEDVKYENVERFNVSKTTLPTTTPNCLTNTLFSLLDVEKPDYMNLLNSVCDKSPILAQTYFASSAPTQSEVLKNYELFTYDILGGKQYWLK